MTNAACSPATAMATAATNGPKTMEDSWAAPSRALAASRSPGATILAGRASAAGTAKALQIPYKVARMASWVSEPASAMAPAARAQAR